MPTITEKLTELNNIKTNIKEAIKSKGVVVEDTTPFNQYPSKIGQLSLHLFNSNTYACSIDGSEIDTEAKRNAVIMQHCNNARAAGKTEIFFVFKGNMESSDLSSSTGSAFNPTFSDPSPVLANIQKVSVIFDDSVAHSSRGNYMAMLFYKCTSLTLVRNFDVGQSNLCADMFNGCINLISVTLNNGAIFDIQRMFEGCSKLKEVYLNNTTSVWFTDYMFSRCTNLTSLSGILCKWILNTVGNTLTKHNTKLI